MEQKPVTFDFYVIENSKKKTLKQNLIIQSITLINECIKNFFKILHRAQWCLSKSRKKKTSTMVSVDGMLTLRNVKKLLHHNNIIIN